MAMTDGVIERADFPAAQTPTYPPEEPRASKLDRFIDADNIADLLDDDELGRIGNRVKDEYEIDKASCAEFMDRYKNAMALALQKAEVKTFPWQNAANIKYPLLTTAAIQFAARAYPALVQGRDVVKAKVVGDDPTGQKRNRGERVARHMSWQLLDQMDEWEEDTDRLLHALPIVGCVFRKTYYSTLLRRNVSEMCPADKVVVNKWAKSLEACPRITHRIELYPYQVTERQRSGMFLDVELPKEEKDGDSDAPVDFLEQHRTLDLDDDGYPEPYVVTVHEDSGKVVRIVARYEDEDISYRGDKVQRIEPAQYFTKYGFIPNPDGSFYDLGFGTLLEPLNEAINTAINQMMDAGALQNAGGGLIGSNVKVPSGIVRRKLGEWLKIPMTGNENLSNSVYPWPAQGASPTLFQLLGLLIDAGKDVAGVKDVLTGDQERSQPATTTLALIEQGMKVYSSLYKRIHRALRQELKKLYRLNRINLTEEEYFTVLDTPEAVAPEDYEGESFDIEPVSDPTMVTDMQRLARAEFMMQFVQDPQFDGKLIRMRLLEAANIDGVDELVLDEAQPTPEGQRAQAEAAKAAAELELEKEKAESEAGLREAQRIKTLADAIKSIAEAEAVEPGQQMDWYKLQIEILKTQAAEQTNGDKRGRVPGMATAPDNGGVPAVPAGPVGGPVPAMGVGEEPALPGPGPGTGVL